MGADAQLDGSKHRPDVGLLAGPAAGERAVDERRDAAFRGRGRGAHAQAICHRGRRVKDSLGGLRDAIRTRGAPAGAFTRDAVRRCHLRGDVRDDVIRAAQVPCRERAVRGGGGSPASSYSRDHGWF